MPTTTKLEIVWDGPVKGLAEHRVSLTEFGEALDLLMKAARRIASQKLMDALEPASTGRLAASAKNLDIELTSVKEGSSGFSLLITFEPPPGSQVMLFNELPQIVGQELLDAIDAEAVGQVRNTAVRNYLKALPKHLTRQEYNLYENGSSIRRVEIGTIALPEKQDPLPALIAAKGRISGVGFDPGKWEVKIKGEDTQVVTTATEQQVNKALELRSQDVHVLAVSTASGNRLVVLESEAMRVQRPSLDDLFDKWEATYLALA